jgi:uracil permease
MQTPRYLYGLDEHLPLHSALLYGLQWAFILFPALIIAATLCSGALDLNVRDEIRFLQFTLFTTGLFTIIQTLWGHRYPLLEGPATALVLTFILLAPYGLPSIQGGLVIGGMLLIIIVVSKQLERITRLFTPNVIGVILMLIALGLLPPLVRFMTGADHIHPQGEARIFIISLALALFIAALSYRLKGFWQSISILIGMIAGAWIFYLIGRLHWQKLVGAPWFTLSAQWVTSIPRFHWPAAIAFACAYIAVMVNSLGSLEGAARITDPERLPRSTRRGILVNGIAGISCGILGVAGTVSYSNSPGVILVNRIASRYAIMYCGVIILMAAFVPKLSALLALVPAPVVGSALCVAMGGQIGVGISIVAAQTLTSRDYFVVGIPLLLGTLVGFLPPKLFDSVPGYFQVFLANSLVVGISLVLLLEHLLLRKSAQKR